MHGRLLTFVENINLSYGVLHYSTSLSLSLSLSLCVCVCVCVCVSREPCWKTRPFVLTLHGWIYWTWSP